MLQALAADLEGIDPSDLGFQTNGRTVAAGSVCFVSDAPDIGDVWRRRCSAGSSGRHFLAV